MKLFLLVPTTPAPSRVRFYEAAIVAAATPDDARRVHPATSAANEIVWDVQEGFWRSNWADGTKRPYINTSWPMNVEEVEVTEIGDALPSTKAGLLLARHCIN